MGSRILLEDQLEAVVPVEKQQPSTSIAVSDPSGLDNNLSEDSAVEGASRTVEPEASISTTNMLKLMELSLIHI